MNTYSSSFQISHLKHHLPSITNQTHRPFSLSHTFCTSNTKNNTMFKVDSNKNKAQQVSFDEEKYEAERLSLDAKEREAMAVLAGNETNDDDDDDDDDPKAWKWVIRKRVWDLMEGLNIAQFPRPVHHRIPNFVGAPIAADKMSRLEVFLKAECVKVNPDTPQKQVRFLTLNGGKKLLTPQPRLRTGFFSILESDTLNPSTMKEACTSVGVAKYGKPIGLDEKIKVDLIVIGSVAVDPKNGARLGKGEGFAELEYGMLRYMGAIDDSTPVVTSSKDSFLACITACQNAIDVKILHDEQLVDDIPVEKLLIHDVPVDIICTPTQVIFTDTSIPKPQGIYWDKLSPEKLSQVKVLRELKAKIERETGQKLPTGPSEKLPPTAERRKKR